MENIPGQPFSAEKGRISRSALRYYLSSIPKILTQTENWHEIARILFGSRRVIIRLRNGRRFKVRSLMDLWSSRRRVLIMSMGNPRHGSSLDGHRYRRRDR